jgi:DNA-binding LacI/PurR family transcriptional regulator
MITINEIAKICDVSAMTVSRVVNKKDKGKVSAETRKL